MNHTDNPMNKSDGDGVELGASGTRDEVSSNYYRKNQPLNFMQRLEKCWWAIFCWMPWNSYLVGTYLMPVKIDTPEAWEIIMSEGKDKGDRDQSVRVRGIFNIRNMFDAAGFVWINYLKKDQVAETSTRQRIETESTNIGLLSALVSTICFAMWQSSIGDGFPQGGMGIAYCCAWAGASLLTLTSTVLSVIILLACNVVASDIELDYFIDILNKTSSGVGSNSPLILFYLGCLFSGFGIMFGAALFYSTVGIGVTFSVCAICLYLFFVAYLALVSSLHASRVTCKFMQHDTKAVKLNVDEIKTLIAQCK